MLTNTTPSPERIAKLNELEERIDIRFKNIELLNQALTHSSYKVVSNAVLDNERLEFLGDAVLSLFTVEFLYLNFPQYDEGKLTRIKNYLVSETHLFIIGMELNLGDYVLMSPGEEKNNGRKKHSIVSSTVEALLGAIYLDQNKKGAYHFLKKNFVGAIRNIEDIRDYKSEIQFLIQKNIKISPMYKVEKKQGPNHNTEFVVSLNVDGVEYVRGTGRSKKIAEQDAAKQMWEALVEKRIKIPRMEHVKIPEH